MKSSPQPSLQLAFQDLGDVMDISSDEEAPNTAPPQPVNFTVDMIVQALQDVQKSLGCKLVQTKTAWASIYDRHVILVSKTAIDTSMLPRKRFLYINRE